MKQPMVRKGWIALALLALLAMPVDAQVKDYRDIKFPKLPAREVPRPEVKQAEAATKRKSPIECQLAGVGRSFRRPPGCQAAV